MVSLFKFCCYNPYASIPFTTPELLQKYTVTNCHQKCKYGPNGFFNQQQPPTSHFLQLVVVFTTTVFSIVRLINIISAHFHILCAYIIVGTVACVVGDNELRCVHKHLWTANIVYLGLCLPQKFLLIACVQWVKLHN